jgi:hypothetical protein
MLVVADAGEDEIGVARSVRRCRCDPSAELRNPGFRFRARAIVDRDVVLATRRQMPGYGIAHDAESNECDFAHL